MHSESEKKHKDLIFFQEIQCFPYNFFKNIFYSITDVTIFFKYFQAVHLAENNLKSLEKTSHADQFSTTKTKFEPKFLTWQQILNLDCNFVFIYLL